MTRLVLLAVVGSRSSKTPSVLLLIASTAALVTSHSARPAAVLESQRTTTWTTSTVAAAAWRKCAADGLEGGDNLAARRFEPRVVCADPLFLFVVADIPQAHPVERRTVEGEFGAVHHKVVAAGGAHGGPLSKLQDTLLLLQGTCIEIISWGN